MIGINVQKLQVSLKRLQQVRKKVEGDAAAIFRKKIYWAAELAVMVSPQFSGDFVSNWHVVVDGNMPIYRQGGSEPEIVAVTNSQGKTVYRQNPKQAGDLQYAPMNRIASQLRGVTLKSNVHLVNASALDTDGKYMIGPDGKEKLRPVNIIPGALRIEQYVRARVKDYKPQSVPTI